MHCIGIDKLESIFFIMKKTLVVGIILVFISAHFCFSLITSVLYHNDPELMMKYENNEFNTSDIYYEVIITYLLFIILTLPIGTYLVYKNYSKQKTKI